MSVNYIVMLSGSVIVGNVVGGNGLAGVNVCTPVFGIASCLAALLSVGAGLLFSQTMGAFDERRAAGIFSQTIALAALLGIAIAGLMALLGPFYLDFTGVTGAIRAQAASYWRGETLALALMPLVLVMEALVYADGDGPVAMLAGVTHVCGSIGLSDLFTNLTESAGGVAWGTATTMCLVLMVASLHFLRKHNHLKFVAYWSKRDFLATCAGSLADATIYLCWGLLILLVNKFTVVQFGERLLPVVALAASVVELSIVFDGVGEALIPLGGLYQGEGNHPALRSLANYSALVATLEGLVFGFIFFLFAPQLAALYGIRGDAAFLLPEAVAMMRILACAMPFMGFLMMVNTHFLVVRHIPLALSVTIVKDFLLPGLLAFPFAFIWGFKGIWIGFAVGYALSAAYPFLVVLVKHGKRALPWLIPADEGKILCFSVPSGAEEVSLARERLSSCLSQRGLVAGLKQEVLSVWNQLEDQRAHNLKGRPSPTEYTVFLLSPEAVRLLVTDGAPAYDLSVPEVHAPFQLAFRTLNTLGCNRIELVVSIDLSD